MNKTKRKEGRKGKGKGKETILGEVQTRDLLVKVVTLMALNMLNDRKKAMDKKLKEIKKMTYKQNENINKETKLKKKGSKQKFWSWKYNN